MRENLRLADPDLALEERIGQALRKFKGNPNRVTWLALTELVKRRSPRQVELMERSKGLR